VATEPVLLEGRKILITGPTSQVAFPLARELAKSNEVHGMARFGRAEDRERIEAVGVHPLTIVPGARPPRLRLRPELRRREER
jgi:nucleoside-diphosphate-sugar epimerase